ncbi:MAG: aminoacetone oxidase family FAD-binding enzyme [Gammaproteobacteria bacterium]|nr:aminoacetone oxidase family FAD-binding enzyme [Gammaproteobacteria bacterium]
MPYDLAIVGLGPSSAAMAITYKRLNPNKKVCIFEKYPVALRKLSSTGNGKGNFTNDNLSPLIYDNSEFVSQVFGENPKEKLLLFIDSLGLKYFKDEEGRFYPLSLSAKTITHALLRELSSLYVDIEYEAFVEKVYKNEDGLFVLNTVNGSYTAKSVALATGSINYQSLGGDGNMFVSLKDFGHTVTKLVQSNIYIKVNEKAITKRLSGLRFNARVYLINDGEEYYHEDGELLFKDNALSGIVTFNVSNRLARLYKKGLDCNPEIVIDFLKDQDTEEIVNYIFNSKNVYESLYNIVHPELAKVICDNYGHSNKEIVQNLFSMRFTVAGLGDIENAQATSGGIPTTELKDTMESKIVDNLYVLGDLVDTDAPSGGFNLSFAFLSGIKAGESLE